MNGWPVVLAAAIVAAIIAVPLTMRWEFGPQPAGDVVADDFNAMPLSRTVRTVSIPKPPPTPPPPPTPTPAPTPTPTPTPPPPPAPTPAPPPPPTPTPTPTPPSSINHRDVCAIYGRHRVSITRHHHTYWRCSRRRN